MRLTCSACGAHGSIELFTADAEARSALAQAAGLPGGVGAVAVRYIALFRPAKRGLTWDRVCRLLGEISAMVEAGQVERHGKAIPVTTTMFASAMQRVVDQRERMDLPLTSHGYLITILAGDAPREAARLEQQTEDEKRSASARRRGPVESSEERIARMRREAEAADARRLAEQGKTRHLSSLMSSAIKRVDS